MRGGRSLLVLMVIALGLGAYIYFVESERDPDANAAEVKAKVFSAEASDITELEVRKAGAEPPTTLRKVDGSWSLTAPTQARADAAAVDAVITGLTTMEIDRVLEDNATNLAPYGLDTPRFSVAFQTTDGTRRELLLGNTTPTSSGLYARISGDPRLLLIPAYHERTFDRSAFDLRDRQALAVNAGDVERLALAPRGATAVELRRENTTWRLTAPVAARADANAVENLVNRVSTAQMSSVVAEGGEPSAANLRTWGLDTPRFVATVGTGSSTASLAIGIARDDASVYARDLSRPIVFTVDAALLADLQKNADDLRVKDVFDLNAFSAQSLDITHGATAVAFLKATPTDDAATPSWSRTKPSAGEVNQTALTDLLNTLSSLRAERFVSSAPTSGDDVVVAARHGTSDAQVDEHVTLRKTGSTVYALRSGEPGAAVVTPAQFDTLLAQLKTLTDGQ